MSWLSILKFLAPIAAIAGIYFYAHNAGWNERDATVAQEKQDAVDKAVTKAVGDERTACAGEIKMLGGINAKLSKGLEAANNNRAAAIGSLWDAVHGAGGTQGVAGAAGGDHDAAGAGRLYYADPAGAIPAIDRATVATKQAEQLIGCQAYINGVRGAGKDIPAISVH